MSANRLLDALPPLEIQRLALDSELTELTAGQVLYQSGDVIHTVYFPYTAIISLMAQLDDSSKIEVGVLGYEGMLGLSVVLGSDRTMHEAVVQVGGSALQLSAALLLSEFHRGETLQNLLLRYTEMRLMYCAQIAACRSWHTVEQRLARWLLLLQDCAQLQELPLTQQLISEKLGVRRATITEAAMVLQGAGCIRYSRGHLNISDRKGLERLSCECYRHIRKERERLLP